MPEFRTEKEILEDKIEGLQKENAKLREAHKQSLNLLEGSLLDVSNYDEDTDTHLSLVRDFLT